jgi:hypothetical protein
VQFDSTSKNVKQILMTAGPIKVAATMPNRDRGRDIRHFFQP